MGITEKLKQHDRLSISFLLFTMTVFSFSLFIFRFHITGSRMFMFLNWNLFLAFIPWAATTLFVIYPSLQNKKWALFSLLPIWLLFFPNAPYILTDLFHLKERAAAPIWFDLVLILSFAWTGLIAGFISLMDIESILRSKTTGFIASATVASLLFLSAFGIYLGRFLRWNSWDIIQAPEGLLFDIGHRVGHPMSHPRTWGMTLLMGALLNFMYWSIKQVRKRPGVT